MRTKMEQQRHLRQLRAKASATGTRHGKGIRRARITTGQTFESAAVGSWSYLRAVASNA
jgi:hypothetical protein